MICWDAHRLRRTCSEIRHRTSEADIFDSRRRRHSSSTDFMIRAMPDALQRRAPGRHNCCGVKLATCGALPAARVARVVAASESREMGIGPPVRTDSTKALISAD